MTSETPLRLRASPSAPTRKDVHERDQGDDHHRSDSDDGNRGCGDDHARIVSGNLFVKTLSGEWYGSRSTESGGKRRDHAEVSVKSDACKTTDAKRLQAALVLEPTEGALDCAASTVEVAPPLRLARDEGMQAACRDPLGERSALASRAAPLRALVLEVGTRELPNAVLAGRRKMVAALDALSLLERDDWANAASLASVMDRFGVIALVHDGRLGREAERPRRIEKRKREARLMVAGCLNAPSDGKLCSCADGGADLVAVEATALARGHSGAMPPGGVGIAEPLALRAVLGDETVTVSEARQVGGVNRNVAAVIGKLDTERSGKRRVRPASAGLPIGVNR